MPGEYSRVEANESEPFPDFDPPHSSRLNRQTSRDASQQNQTGRHERSSSMSSKSSASTDLELEQLDPGNPLDVDEEAALSRERKELQRDHRARATSLSGRISPGDEHDEGTSPDADKLGSQAFMTNVAINVSLILLWYLFSVSISVYNKWMFADKNLNFHFPLFTTSGHMIVQFVLSSLVLICIPRLRPGNGSDAEAAQTDEPTKQLKPLMTSWFYLTRIAPCASATGLDIGLGNTSLRFVTLTFFTMCKSSTLGFVLAFAIVFRLEKLSWKLAGIIAIMTIGVIMMVAGETAFSTLGFVLLMLASFFSGLRWSLTQILLRRNPATSNPFASLFFLTPVMFLTLIVIAIPVEGLSEVGAGVIDLMDRKGVFWCLGILLTPGVLAFLMTSSEFALLKRTSVVTLSVCGIFKEVITIGAGGLFFDDQLTAINISGVMVTIVAIAGYNYIRMRKMKRQAVRQAQEMSEEEHAPMLSTDPDIDASQGPIKHGRRVSTGDMINQSLRISTDGGRRSRVGSQGRETPRSAKSPSLRKLPENIE